MEPVTAMLLLGGANIGMGAMKAQQAAKQRQQEANIRAAEIEASPWTGKAPSTQISTGSLNPWAEMAGGAINTVSQMQSLQKANADTKAAEQASKWNDMLMDKMSGAKPGDLSIDQLISLSKLNK